MKCRLCDRPTTPGTGKLCLDCTKALHRARAGSAAARKQAGVAARSARGHGDDGSSARPLPRRRSWHRAGGGTVHGQPPASSRSESSISPSPDRSLGTPSMRSSSTAAPAASAERSRADSSAVIDPVGRTVIGGARRLPRKLPASPEPQAKAETNVAKTSPSSAGTKTTSRNATAERQQGRARFVARLRVCERRGNEQIARAGGSRNVATAGAGEHPRRTRQRTARRRWRVRWRSAARRLSCRASSASRRCTCSTAKTNGTRIPAACARQETTRPVSGGGRGAAAIPGPPIPTQRRRGR